MQTIRSHPRSMLFLAICASVFAVAQLTDVENVRFLALDSAMFPERWWTIVTTGFVRAEWNHIVVNMLLLWVGTWVGRLIGSRRYAVPVLTAILAGSVSILVRDTAGIGFSAAPAAIVVYYHVASPCERELPLGIPNIVLLVVLFVGSLAAAVSDCRGGTDSSEPVSGCGSSSAGSGRGGPGNAGRCSGSRRGRRSTARCQLGGGVGTGRRTVVSARRRRPSPGPRSAPATKTSRSASVRVASSSSSAHRATGLVLRHHLAIDPARVRVIGHSEGAIHAISLAAADEVVLRVQGRRRNAGWRRGFLAHDPVAELARVTVPVFAVTGDGDL